MKSEWLKLNEKWTVVLANPNGNMRPISAVREWQFCGMKFTFLGAAIIL